MKSLVLCIAVLFTISAIAQNFEGKIIYKDSYQSKMANVTSEQLTAMLSAVQEYHIKGGEYKTVNNGTYFQW